MVAEVIINRMAKDLNRNFDYIIPEKLISEIKIGSRVFVPFGATKKVEGFVISIKEKSEFANKEIISVEDNLLNKEHINLAKLMGRRYFCNISDCIKLMLPPGAGKKDFNKRVKDKTANFVYLKKDIDEIEFLLETEKIKSEKQIRILKFLEENEGIHITDLELITDTSKAVINTLEKNGYIEIVEEKVERNPFANRTIKRDKKLELTDEQKEAYNKIKDSKFNEFLIYGVTGSRKNRNIFAINRKCNKQRKKSDCISSRNIFNTTNGR